jgi:hypothetical protein
LKIRHHQSMQHDYGAFGLAFRTLFVRCLHHLSASDGSDVRSNSSQSQVLLTDTCAASGRFESLSGHCGACEYRGCLLENKHPSQLQNSFSNDIFKRRAASSSKLSVSSASAASRCSTTEQSGAHEGGESCDSALTPAGVGCCVCSDGAVMIGTFSGDSSCGCGYLSLGSAGR